MIIDVPATSANLGPGFDTLGIALKMHNRAVIKKSNFFSLSIKGEGSDRKRFKNNNLFVKIFYEVYEEITGKRDNFRFEFYNKIPVSRGLGSSSAVITSAITAACAFGKGDIDKQNILDKALVYESHPDNIAPAVYGGFTVSVVENGKVYTQKKDMPSSLQAVVVIPNRAMSTARSRTALPKEYEVEDIVYNLSRSSFLSSAFFSERWDLLKIASKDRLHQERRMANMKKLFEVQKTALENGALMSTLSGSGSTFFNIAYKDDAKNLAQSLKKRFPYFRVETIDFDNIGLKVNF
jgi:homoserine kinase